MLEAVRREEPREAVPSVQMVSNGLAHSHQNRSRGFHGGAVGGLQRQRPGVGLGVVVGQPHRSASWVSQVLLA